MSNPNAPRMFALYFLADSHGLNDDWPRGVLAHIEANFEPDTRVLVVYGGDLFVIGPGEVNDREAIKAHYDALLANPALTALRARAGFVHQWDDWDFLGDNSCETHSGDRGDKRIDRWLPIGPRMGFDLETFPAGVPQLDTSTAGWFLRFGDSLILAPDSRSMKQALAVTGEDGACRCMMDGSGNPHIWGIEQWRAMEALLTDHATRPEPGRVYFVSTQTFVDNLDVPLRPCDGHTMGARDSLGIYHKWWRNELLSLVRRLGLEERFTVLSGDDHTALVRERDFWCGPHHFSGGEMPWFVPALDGLRVREWKAGNGGSTTRIFDSADHPPLWWGGPAGEYERCAWGQDDAPADVGFCFSWPAKQPLNVTARAVLFEGPDAPHEYWQRGIDA